jgi:quinol monooxygenase YgiN
VTIELAKYGGDMNAKHFLIFAASLLAPVLICAAFADETQSRYVRLAELEIDPAQLESFKAAIKEGIEAAIRVEPDVLVLHAVSEKDNPARIRVFEMYTNADAYQTHLQTPHFQKFRTTTDKMVISRKLLDAVPIALGAKAK